MGNCMSMRRGASTNAVTTATANRSDPIPSHVEPAGASTECSDTGDAFIDALLPYIGNGDNYDLLYALSKKLRRDEELETDREDSDKSLIQSHRTEKKVDAQHILKYVETVQEVIDAVKDARKNKYLLRAAGSEHAPAITIFPEEEYGVTLGLKGDLRLVEMIKVEENGAFAEFRVGGGCYLGRNPADPSSTVENGLCYQVNSKGYALPITGGITQQSVGGYMTTGAAGGSIQHSFAETVQQIEFVDGTGTHHVVARGSDDWCAVGVSMGLLGIITAVTFRLGRTYLVEGYTNNAKFADSVLGADDSGNSRLRESIGNNEYFHVNWFPQEYVQRVMQWTGKRTEKGEIIADRNPVGGPLSSFAGAVVLMICNRLLENCPDTASYKFIGMLLRQFVPLGKTFFRDVWYKTLPSDDTVPVDTIMKVDFTEIWLPLDQCQTMMDRLNNLFEDQLAAGSFATEIYCAKESPFWLSMAYKRDVVRVDPYWYHFNKGDIRAYYTYFWDALLDLPGARLHWGKYLPLTGQKCGNITFNLSYLKEAYPKLGDWLASREKFDPDQIFVTNYWRGILEIPRLSLK